MNKPVILVAPNEFKESATSVEVAKIIYDKIRTDFPEDFEIFAQPVSDGGDGFLETLKFKGEIEVFYLPVSSPTEERDKLNVPIGYSRKNKTAYLESSSVIGLKVVPRQKRNPLALNSSALGVILKMLNEMNLRKEIDVSRLVIGLGGTATQDLGLGLASVFGLRILRCGRALPVQPKFYSRVNKIDYLNENFSLSYEIDAVVDVENPLLGENGANQTFAKQKGASDAEITELEKGFRNILRLLHIENPQKESGAAGGLAFALKIFFGARLISSRDFILNEYLSDLPQPDFVITGEGKLDEQTLNGKAPQIVYEYFAAKNIPVFFILGKNELENTNYEVREILKYYETEAEAIENPRIGIEKAVEEIIKNIWRK